MIKKGKKMKKLIFTTILFVGTSLFAMNVAELNKASKEELMSINGIGEAKADAIIVEREKAKFKSVDELTRVKGVGPKIVENVKKDVKVKEKNKTKEKTKSATK